jgi:hypothetical protein
LAVAAELAQRIVAAGLGRIRRVVLIGSRARGAAQPASDLDLVVLVELPHGSRAWGPAESLAERDRIQRAVGVPPITTDLSVRTTDHYHEARQVVGGVEHLVDLEGVEVYSHPLSNPPTIRRMPAQVRWEHAGTWITHSTAVLEVATSVRGDCGDAYAARLTSAAHASAMRAITALLVTHQLFSSKRDGIRAMLAQLGCVDAKSAQELRAILELADPPFQKAQAVLRLVVQRLGEDPGMTPYLQQAHAWLRKAAMPGTLKTDRAR